MQETHQEPLTKKLAKTIRRYDLADLLATVGGLQLMPENANRALRLEMLANVIASLSYESRRPFISNARIKSTLNSGPLADGSLVSLEDPCENCFTESFSFHGGSFIVFPGIIEESTFILRHLAESLLKEATPLQDSWFEREIRALIASVLAISDTIARRAGLGRGIEPNSPFRGPIIVPSSKRLFQLKQAVSFSQKEMYQLLQEKGGYSSTLERLVIDFGSISYDEINFDGAPLYIKPIVRIKDSFIVAIPSLLLTAARHELIRLAFERGISDEVAYRFNQHVWGTVKESFLRLGNEPLQYPPPSISNSIRCFHHGLFELDRDKLIYASLITDPFDSYDFDNVFGRWPTIGLDKELDGAWQQVEKVILSSAVPPNEVCRIILFQGIGRNMVLGFSGPLSQTMSVFHSLSASELEVLSWLEGRDPLVLYKYAQAASKLRESTVVHVSNELDEFYMYRSRDYSYYLSDKARPNFLAIQPGGTGELRREVIRERDWHSVPSYEPGYIIEVTTLFDTREIPVYIAESDLNRNRISVLVEGLPLPVWILNQSYSGEEEKDLHANYLLFARAIGYWLWQFTPALTPIVSTIAEKNQALLITLYLSPGEKWHRYSKTEKSTEAPIVISSNPGADTISVRLNPGITSLLEGADNQGERELIRHILSGLQQKLPETDRYRLSDNSITKILDTYAPLGIKKMILFLDSNNAPDLDRNGLPPYRKVQAADSSQLRDELGNYLQKAEGLSVSQISEEQRTVILAKVVAYYYKELERLVATLSPDGLLEWLIAHQEAITQETASHRLTLPTRLACFSSEPKMIEALDQELPERASAGTASRFVIEYVAAKPPSGLRPISLTVYDRLQALAIEIINFAYDSDLVHFQLANLGFAMLASGRLGIDRDELEQAHNKYMSAYSMFELERRKFGFHYYWRSSEAKIDDEESNLLLESATRAEFGHSLTELMSLMVQAFNIGRELEPDVAILPLPELIQRLVSILGWEKNKIEQILDLLSLRSRPDYLKPPPPHRREDVYPWRFNRSLSYLRRPFVQRERNDMTEVLWGNRNLYNVWNYLAYLCRGGRLQAKSLQMRQFISRINIEHGADFNNRVADVFEGKSNLKVRRRVKKIGTKRLEDSTGELGDIDVLVFDIKKKRIRALECKDLAIARTPYEMSSEVINLFQGYEGSRPIVERHRRRVQWLREHLDEVLAWVSLIRTGKWKIEGLIVVDEPLFTPYMQQSPIRVLTLDELIKYSSHD